MIANANPLKPLAGLDHGTPPDALTDQAARVHSLLRVGQSAGPAGSVTDSAGSGRPPQAVELEASGQVEDTLPTQRTVYPVQERVELEYVPEKPDLPAFRLAFTVGEICVRENYVSMLIISDLGFKPTTTMKFDLKYRGKVLPVIFAGAEFEFQTVGVRGISFLIDRNRKDKPAGSPLK